MKKQFITLTTLFLAIAFLFGAKSLFAGGKEDALTDLISEYKSEQHHWDLYIVTHCGEDETSPKCKAAKDLALSYADLVAEAIKEMPESYFKKKGVYELPSIPKPPAATASTPSTPLSDNN